MRANKRPRVRAGPLSIPFIANNLLTLPKDNKLVADKVPDEGDDGAKTLDGKRPVLSG